MKKLFPIFSFIINAVFFVIIVSLLISDSSEKNHIGMTLLILGLLIIISANFILHTYYSQGLRQKRKMYKNAIKTLHLSHRIQESKLRNEIEQSKKIIASLDDEIRCKTEEYKKLKEKINEINSIYKADEENLVIPQ